MKIDTLILLGVAAGVGFLIAKRKAKPATTPGEAPQRAATALREEDAEVVFVQPAVEYVPYPAPWGYPWMGFGVGFGGRRHHHHHGGGHRGGRRR